mmetsp:Transcript_22657/g.68105  ORF Transcript_22657/g.68105 Transcript_22657/m.68105 type:complete len:246 (-) Transcript_22657:274-1011(-)
MSDLSLVRLVYRKSEHAHREIFHARTELVEVPRELMRAIRIHQRECEQNQVQQAHTHEHAPSIIQQLFVFEFNQLVHFPMVAASRSFPAGLIQLGQRRLQAAIPLHDPEHHRGGHGGHEHETLEAVEQRQAWPDDITAHQCSAQAVALRNRVFAQLPIAHMAQVPRAYAVQDRLVAPRTLLLPGQGPAAAQGLRARAQQLRILADFLGAKPARHLFEPRSEAASHEQELGKRPDDDDGDQRLQYL